MRFDFRQEDDQFFHTDTGLDAGHIIPLKNGKGFSVHRALTNSNERDKIAVVKSSDEALEIITDYYKKHWPQWKQIRDSRYDRDEGYTLYTAYIKWSFYGVFRVEQQEDGRWVATRCREKLLRHGKEAGFAKAEIARYTVDLHEYDGTPGYPTGHDGFAWEPYRPLPISAQAA
jgi:hypothetical protein